MEIKDSRAGAQESFAIIHPKGTVVKELGKLI